MNFKKWLFGSERPTPQEIEEEVAEIISLSNGMKQPLKDEFIQKSIQDMRHFMIHGGSERGWEKEDYETALRLLLSRMRRPR